MMTTEPPIGLLLRRLDRLIEEELARVLAGVGLVRRQWQVLNLLAEGPSTVAEVQGRLAAFGEDVVPQLDSLRARGLLASEHLALTGAGRALLVEAGEKVASARRLVVRGLAEGEYERTLAALTVMIRNLEESTGG